MARSAAAVVKVTNGSTGYGSLVCGAAVATDVPLTLNGAASQSGNYVDIKKSTGDRVFDLSASHVVYLANAGTAPSSNPTGGVLLYADPADGKCKVRDPAGTITTLAPVRGWIDGLVLSNDATDANNDIDVAAGAATDSTNVATMTLASALVKQLDASWAVGTNQGGLDTGSKANSTWYHVWLVQRSDTGVVDALFSTSASSPTMPANYDRKRRIGAVRTDGSGNLLAFRQQGDRFRWGTRAVDLNTASPATTATLLTLTVPTGVSVLAFGRCDVTLSAGATRYLSIYDATATGTATARLITAPTAGEYVAPYQEWTNTSGQVYYVLDSATSVSAATIFVDGWEDLRGKDA